jgi:hypothetical protein
MATVKCIETIKKPATRATYDPTTHKQINPAFTTCTFKRFSDGTTAYHSPAIGYIQPFQRRSDMASAANNPKAKVEGSDKAYNRIFAEYQKSAATVPDKMRSGVNANYIGKVCKGIGADGGINWKLTMADANLHRAIFSATKQQADAPFNITDGAWQARDRHEAIIGDKEFYMAVYRAAIVADERSNQITLKFDSGKVTVMAVSEGCEFEQIVELESTTKAPVITVGFNADYLLGVLGCWPLRVTWKDAESHWCFGPVDDSWQAVIMPMRA